MTTFKDYTDYKFGILTVLHRDKNHVDVKGKTRVRWKCLCECGKETSVLSGNINKTKSCGCLNHKPKNTKHGKRYSSEYNSWRGMKKRCYQESHKSFVDYGGRGITVCDEWKDSFENFYNDMGDKPSSGHSIDRKNVNGNYEPDNCRWATHSEQNKNKRKN